MNYAAIKECDIANGPGVRVSLFVSGCRHHCKGCFNREAWDFNYGKPFGEAEMKKIIEEMGNEYIEGFSVLGGEPFEKENMPVVFDVIRTVRRLFPNKTIWCYSGSVFEELKDRAADILSLIDVLVDGEFEEERKNLKLKFRGSENQRLIDVKKTLECGRIIEWE